MKRSVVVFDVDKTLVKGDFHILIADSWTKSRPRRRTLWRAVELFRSTLRIGFLRRKFEYLAVEFIGSEFIKNETRRVLDSDDLVNRILLRRLLKYQKKGVEVLLITAAPWKTASALSAALNADVVSSRMRFGYLIEDLLGKKGRIYRKLESENWVIRTIYSDSTLDFWGNARKNVLVSADGFRWFVK